ncbi:hypothetical protein C9374_012798 [Naegleria lovaniensis]|uniref:Uncharacterized protein n=1 Tax=Naegleria lovaniensis TaxID=51637 RepID=A0AA88GB23_NAELO|nr:uncharacterized protein C9374_012798 [Naegleria lovaniensis]KAG2373196.1 hypothetical protein C9374_012798 [Naegleria lovaniensis]
MPSSNDHLKATRTPLKSSGTTNPKSPLVGVPSSLSALKKRKAFIPKDVSDSEQEEDEVLFSRANIRMASIKQEPLLITCCTTNNVNNCTIQSHPPAAAAVIESGVEHSRNMEGLQWEEASVKHQDSKRTLKTISWYQPFIFEYDCHHDEHEQLVMECNKMLQSEEW